MDEELACNKALLLRQCVSVIKDLMVMIAVNLSVLVNLCVVTEGPVRCWVAFQLVHVTMALMGVRASVAYLDLLDLNVKNA